MNKGILLGVGAIIGYFLLRSKTTEAAEVAETDDTGDGGGSSVDYESGDEYGLLIPGAGGGGGGGDYGDDDTGDDDNNVETAVEPEVDFIDLDDTGDTDDGGDDDGDDEEGGGGIDESPPYPPIDESPYPPLTPVDPYVELFQVGDVNLDGAVNIVDAMLVAQYLNGMRTFSPLQMKLADVNQDGVISQSDAQMIANYTVGIASIPDVWFDGTGIVVHKQG